MSKNEKNNIQDTNQSNYDSSILTGNYYWVKAYEGAEFEPAQAAIDSRDRCYFTFIGDDEVYLRDIVEFKPLNHKET